MLLQGICFQLYPPENTRLLWVKAGADNQNTFWVYDGGWKKISGGGSGVSISIVQGNGIKVFEENGTYTISISEELYQKIENPQIEVDGTLSATSENPVQNKVITEQLNRLNNEVFPLSLSVSGGGTYKKGSSQNVIVRWTVKQGDETVTPDSIKINNVDIPAGNTQQIYSGVTVTTTYNVVITYNGQEKSASTTATFVAPSYIGAVASDFVPDSENVALLTEVIKGTRSYTWIGNLNNQKICYTYPKSFGALTSIKDGNNFENLPAYTRTELTIGDDSYYVYTLTDPTTNTGVTQRYS